MTQDQFIATGFLCLVLAMIFGLIADQARYDLKDISAFLGFVFLAVSAVSFLLAIWGEGWLYG